MAPRRLIFNHKGGAGGGGSDLCAVKKLRRLASTLAAVSDLGELLQRHAVLARCSTVWEGVISPSAGSTAPLPAKQALESIFRLQPSRAPPRAPPPPRWRPLDLLPGTTVLPGTPGVQQNKDGGSYMKQHAANIKFVQPLADMRLKYQSAGLALQYVQQSTEAEELGQTHFQHDKNNSHNSPGGDLKTIYQHSKQEMLKVHSDEDTKQIQTTPQTNNFFNSENRQNTTWTHQPHKTVTKPICENDVSCKLNDSSTHSKPSDTQLFKENASSYKVHGPCEKDVPRWTEAASKIRFKPLPETRSRPIQPIADDFTLVMRLLEQDYKNDPELLKAIGVAESRNEIRCRRTSRFKTLLAYIPGPLQQPSAPSSNRAQKPSEDRRRVQRASTSQRRPKGRTTKPSGNKKTTGGGAHPTAYCRHSVYKPSVTTSKTQNVQGRQSVTLQRVQKSSTVISNLRTTSDVKRFQQPTKTNPNKLSTTGSGTCRISQASIPTAQSSKLRITSNMGRVLEASTTKTQNVLKRAASDFQRLSRTSTPVTNSLLKRVASDLKKISRTSMSSIHNLQQGGSKICTTNSARTVKDGSKLNQTSPLSQCSSLQIKCHMPLVTSSTESNCLTRKATTKLWNTESHLRSSTKAKDNSVTGNPVHAMYLPQAEENLEKKTRKNSPLDGVRLPKMWNNSQDTSENSSVYLCSKMLLSEASAGKCSSDADGTEEAGKPNIWGRLRPPEFCNQTAEQNALSSTWGSLPPPAAEISTVNEAAISNIWSGLRPPITKPTTVTKIPSLVPYKAPSKECVRKSEITEISDQQQLSKCEGKECVLYKGPSQALDTQGDAKDIESFVPADTSQVLGASTVAHSATTKPPSSVSLSQETFTFHETLSIQQQSSSSSVSSIESFSGSDSFSRLEVNYVNKKTLNNESRNIGSKNSPASSGIPFFRKVQNIFRNRFFRCRSKLLCMRSGSCGCGSATSLN